MSYVYEYMTNIHNIMLYVVRLDVWCIYNNKL